MYWMRFKTIYKISVIKTLIILWNISQSFCRIIGQHLYSYSSFSQFPYSTAYKKKTLLFNFYYTLLYLINFSIRYSQLVVKHVIIGVVVGSEVVLGPSTLAPQRGVPLEQLVSRQRLRPGSGYLTVKVLTDGPTRVLQVTDIKDSVRPHPEQYSWNI